MALYDGKNIRGSIGDVSFRKIDKNTTTVQSNPGKGNVKQTENTKKSASLFGRLSSPFAKHIRFNLKNLVNGFADRKMVNRMNSAISTIVNQHLEADGNIVFNADSFNRLKGFEFNVNSLLVDSLLLLPQVDYEADKVHIRFPAFKVSKNIKFPENVDQVSIQIQPVFFNLKLGRAKRGQTHFLELNRSDTMKEAVTFSADFLAGSVCIIGIGLLFRDQLGIANDKLFNPAGICAAHYKEGNIAEEALEDWYRTGFRLDE